jgi:hypothetical protein
MSFTIADVAAALKAVYEPPIRGFNTKRKRQRKKLMKSQAYQLRMVFKRGLYSTKFYLTK